jgi:hypothetical protein
MNGSAETDRVRVVGDDAGIRELLLSALGSG